MFSDVKPVIELDRTYTIEEFMHLPDNGRQYELVRGKLVEMSGPSGRHGLIIFELGGYLNDYLKTNPIGRGFSNTSFVLDKENNTARIPDLAFVVNERLVNVDFDNAFPEPPDLAVEVMSPTDKWSEVIDKVRLYQTVEIKLVWIIDPFDQGVFVYPLNQPRQALILGDELDGGNLLPGFKLPLKTLFK